MTRASRAKFVTLDETVLLPGPDALLAPEWVPWSERLRPGDMGPGDLLPTEAEDLRLEPGYAGEELRPPNSPVVEDEAEPLAELAGTSDLRGAPRKRARTLRRVRRVRLLRCRSAARSPRVAEELGMRRVACALPLRAALGGRPLGGRRTAPGPPWRRRPRRPA